MDLLSFRYFIFTMSSFGSFNENEEKFDKLDAGNEKKENKYEVNPLPKTNCHRIKSEVFADKGYEWTDAVITECDLMILVGHFSFPFRYRSCRDVGLWLYRPGDCPLFMVCEIPEGTYGNRLTYSRKQRILLVWTKGLAHVNQYSVQNESFSVDFIQTLQLPHNLAALQLSDDEKEVRFLFDLPDPKSRGTAITALVCSSHLSLEMPSSPTLKSPKEKRLTKDERFCANCLLQNTYPCTPLDRKVPFLSKTQILGFCVRCDPELTETELAGNLIKDDRFIFAACPYTVVIYLIRNPIVATLVEIYGLESQIIRRVSVILAHDIITEKHLSLRVVEPSTVVILTPTKFVVIP